MVFNKDENVHRFALRGDIFLFYDIYTGYLLSIVERERERERGREREREERERESERERE